MPGFLCGIKFDVEGAFRLPPVQKNDCALLAFSLPKAVVDKALRERPQAASIGDLDFGFNVDSEDWIRSTPEVDPEMSPEAGAQWSDHYVFHHTRCPFGPKKTP